MQPLPFVGGAELLWFSVPHTLGEHLWMIFTDVLHLPSPLHPSSHANNPSGCSCCLPSRLIHLPELPRFSGGSRRTEWYVYNNSHLPVTLSDVDACDYSKPRENRIHEQHPSPRCPASFTPSKNRKVGRKVDHSNTKTTHQEQLEPYGELASMN